MPRACCCVLLLFIACSLAAQDAGNPLPPEPRPLGEEFFDRIQKKRDDEINAMQRDVKTRVYLQIGLFVMAVLCAGFLGYKAHSTGRPVGIWIFAGFFGGPVGFVFWWIMSAMERAKTERDILEAAEEAARPKAVPKTQQEIDAALAGSLSAALPASTPGAVLVQFKDLVQARLKDLNARSVGANDGGVLFLRNLFSGKYGSGAVAALVEAGQPESAALEGPAACIPALQKYRDWRVLQKYLYELQKENAQVQALGEYYKAARA